MYGSAQQHCAVDLFTEFRGETTGFWVENRRYIRLGAQELYIAGVEWNGWRALFIEGFFFLSEQTRLYILKITFYISQQKVQEGGSSRLSYSIFRGKLLAM